MFSTYKNGLGRVEFTPATGRIYHAEITRPSSVTERYALPLAEDKGCVLRTYDDYDGQEKALVLNKTNATALANAFGKKYANWVGELVSLFSAPTSYGEGVRVRPLRKPATVAKPDPDLDDAISF